MACVKVLNVNGGIMDRGGISSYMMNYYRHINKALIHMDFAVHGDSKGVYDGEIAASGSRLYHLPVKSKDFFGNIREFKKILKKGNYDIVHAHLDAGNAHILKIAQKCGVPVRISHSHNTEFLVSNKLRMLVNKMQRSSLPKYATHLFACSRAAANWLYGGTDGITIVNNAINVPKYKYNEDNRGRVRTALGLEGEFLIAHIGRFDYQKNHRFIIDVARSMAADCPEAKLLLIGEGHLKGEIQELAKDLSNIIFLGGRDDIPELLSASDLFILPSLFEGLPVVGVEAQANGVPCLFSKNVTREIEINENVDFIDLNVSDWRCGIKNIYDKPGGDRTEVDLLSSKFDIKHAVKELESMYTGMVNK